MKGLGILFLIYFCMSIEVAKSEEDKSEQVAVAKEMIKGLADDCKKDEEATDADIEDMIENRKEASYKSKCVRKCLMKTFNLMEDDGNIPIKNFLELAEMLSEGKEDVLTTVSEIAETCKDIQHEDQCEKAFEFGMCLEENARAKGLY